MLQESSRKANISFFQTQGARLSDGSGSWKGLESPTNCILFSEICLNVQEISMRSLTVQIQEMSSFLQSGLNGSLWTTVVALRFPRFIVAG
jgi:hypothetical protein